MRRLANAIAKDERNVLNFEEEFVSKDDNMDRHSAHDMPYRMLFGGMGGVSCNAEDHAGSLQEIHKSMNGNLCHRGAYHHMVIAKQDAARAISSMPRE